MELIIRDTDLPGVQIITPQVFMDGRGCFYEIFRKYMFPEFVQDNIVGSKQRVLRGLHYQPNHPQGKLMMAVTGTIFEVAVDVRQGSSTFGKWVSHTLTEQNKEIMYIAPGFMTGTLILSDWATLLYKATDYFDPDKIIAVNWNDPDIGIQWPINFPILKDGDEHALTFKEAFGGK